MLATSNPINQKKGKNRRRNKKKQTKVPNGETGASSVRAVESTKNFEFQGLKEFQARVSLYALVSSLPSYVLKRISQHLYLQKDRLSFSLVNKTWHEAGNEALWFTPSFWSTSRFALFYRAVSVNAKLASKVHELNLVLSDNAENQIFLSEDPTHRLFRKSPIADPLIIQKLVKACKSLKKLHVYGWNFDDTSMKKMLSVISDVTTFRLVGSDVLTQLPFLDTSMNLRSLTLDANLSLNDLFVRISSARFRSLRSLRLVASNITEKGLNMLADNIQSLQELYIHNSPGLNDTTIERITRNCYNLERISIQHCGITLSSLQLLVESNVNLKEIRLNLLNSNEEDENSVSWMMPICENLELLSLENAMIDDDLLQNIGMHCPKIRELSLIGCRLITDDCIRFFSESLTGLVKINLSGCENLTSGSLFSLLSLQRKSLRSISFKFNGEFDVTNETKNLLRNSSNLAEFHLQGYDDQISTKEWNNILKRFKGPSSSTQTPFTNFISNLKESPKSSRPSSPVSKKETRKRDNENETDVNSPSTSSTLIDEAMAKKKKKEPSEEILPTQPSSNLANGTVKAESIQRVIPWKEWGEGSDESEEEKSISPLPPTTPKMDKFDNNSLHGSGKFGTIRKADALNFLQQLQAVPDILESNSKEEEDFQYFVDEESQPMEVSGEESEEFLYDVEQHVSSEPQIEAQKEAPRFAYNPYAAEFHYEPTDDAVYEQYDDTISPSNEAEFVYSSTEFTEAIQPAEVGDHDAEQAYDDFVYHAEQEVPFDYSEQIATRLTNSSAPDTEEQEIFDYTSEQNPEQFAYFENRQEEEFSYSNDQNQLGSVYLNEQDQDEFVYSKEPNQDEFVYSNEQDQDEFVYTVESNQIESTHPHEEQSEEFLYDYTQAQDKFTYSYEQGVDKSIEVDHHEFTYPQQEQDEFTYNGEMDVNNVTQVSNNSDEEFVYSLAKEETDNAVSSFTEGTYTNSMEEPTSSDEFVYTEIKSELEMKPTAQLDPKPSEVVETFVYQQTDQMDTSEFVYSNEREISSPIPEEFVYSVDPKDYVDHATTIPKKSIHDPIMTGEYEPSYSAPDELTPTQNEFTYSAQEEFVYSDTEPQREHFEDSYHIPELITEDTSEPMNEIDELSDPDVWVGWKTEEEWKRISNNKLSATNVFFKNALSADEAEETLKSLKGYERMIHSAPGSTPGSKTQRQGTLRKQLANFLAEASQIRNEKKEQIQYQTYLEENDIPENMYLPNEAMDWEQSQSVPNFSEYYHHNAYSSPYEEYIYDQLEPSHDVIQAPEPELTLPVAVPEPKFQIQEFGSISTGFKFDYEQIMKEVESIPKSIRKNFAQKSKENMRIFGEEYSSNAENEFDYSAPKYDNGIDEDADDEDDFGFDYTKIKDELSSDVQADTEFVYVSNDPYTTNDEVFDNAESSTQVEDEEFNYLQYSEAIQTVPESKDNLKPESEEFNYVTEIKLNEHQTDSSDVEFSYSALKAQSLESEKSIQPSEDTFDYFEAKSEIATTSNYAEYSEKAESQLEVGVMSASNAAAEVDEFNYVAIKNTSGEVHLVSHLNDHSSDMVPLSPFETSPSWERQVFKEERKLFDTLNVNPIPESTEPEHTKYHVVEYESLDNTTNVSEAVPTISQEIDEGFDYYAAKSHTEQPEVTFNYEQMESHHEETFDYLQEKPIAEGSYELVSEVSNVGNDQHLHGFSSHQESPYDNHSNNFSEVNEGFSHILEPAPISKSGKKKERNISAEAPAESTLLNEQHIADAKMEKSSKSELEHKVFGQASNILKSLLDQAHQSDVEKEQDMSSPEMDLKEDKKSKKKKKKEKELREKEQERKEKKERREKEQKEKDQEKKERKEREQKEKEQERAQREKQKEKKKQEASLESSIKSTALESIHPTLQDSAIEQLLVQLEDKKENSSREKKKEIQLDIDKVKSFTESSQDAISATTNNGKTDEILNSILEMLGLNEGEGKVKGNTVPTNGTIESDTVSPISEKTLISEKKPKRGKGQKQDEIESLDNERSVQPLENGIIPNSEAHNLKEDTANASTEKVTQENDGANINEKDSKKSKQITDVQEIVANNVTSESKKKSKSRHRSHKGKTLVRLDIETREHGQQLLCVKEADHPDHVVERFCYKYDLVDLMPGLLRYVKKIVAKKQKEAGEEF